MESKKKVIEQKRKYPTIDDLIKDEKVLGKLKVWESDQKLPTQTNLITLLMTEEDIGKEILANLETNLNVLIHCLSKREKKDLIGRLLNITDSNELLHLMSELGFARRLYEEGWNIQFNVTFHGKKDVDIKATRSSDERLIEISNLEQEVDPLFQESSSDDGLQYRSPSIPMPKVSDIAEELVRKIVNKYKSKFGGAIEDGWSPECSLWIGIDYFKNDFLQLNKTFLKRALPGDHNDIMEKLTRKIGQACPTLTGIVLYKYDAPYKIAGDIEWVKAGK